MLRIYYGTDWRSCDQAALNELCAAAARQHGGQILIVPEQYSFEAEQRLCQQGGDSISRYAEVLSFTRLATRASAVCGGIVTPVLDQGGRVMAMSRAVDLVLPRLKFYARSAAKADFLQQMLQAVDEFKSYGIDAAALRNAAARLTGNVAVKAEELALLLEGYDAVCAQGAIDPRDRLRRLRDHVRQGYGRGQTLYVQGFAGFTAVELEILGAYLCADVEVTVCLCCDDLFEGLPVFDANRKTARSLLQLADRCGARAVQKQITPSKQEEFCRTALRLFDGSVQADTNDSLILRTCNGVHAEAQLLCAEILAQLCGGCRYRDITVACADYALMRPILEAELARYGIPADFSGKKSVLQTPELGAVLSALDAAAGRMDREDVLDYLKSGFTCLEDDDIDRLENYAITWDLLANRWAGPWTMHPRGFGETMTPEDRAALDALNASRDAAVEPLLQLRSGLRRAKNVGEQVVLLSDFLEDAGFSTQLRHRAQRQQQDGDLQGLQMTQQLYGTLMQALEQLYALQADAVRAPEEFVRLLRVLLNQYDVGAIPARLDCVMVGDAMELQHHHARLLYVCGCADGCFPAFSSGGSLLNESERVALRAAGLELAPDEHDQMDRSLIGSYILLCSAQKRLHLSCGAPTPAYLFTRAQALYPNSVQPQPALPAWHYSRELLGLHLAQQGTVEDAPASVQAYAQQLLQAGDYDFGCLSRQTVKGLYGQELFLSASRIDRYAACRFSYFMQYGLKARERKIASFDAPIYGTFVHYVLEQTGRQVMEEGGFRAVAPERLDEIAMGWMHEFLQRELDPAVLASERFSYLLQRNFDEVRQVAAEMGAELRASSFEPVAFELRFERGGAMPPVEIRGRQATAQISGAVDRVDLFAQGGHTFVRIVDYKTGRKDFDYTDILEKMGLQMLIYLFALQQNGAGCFGSALHPAGVLYVPARVELIAEPQKPTDTELEQHRAKKVCRKGLLLDDDLLLQAMEPCGEANPRYLPYKQTKNGRSGDLMDLQQLRMLRDYVFGALAEMVDEIAGGSVQPNPYSRGPGRGACMYCSYRDACHLELCDSAPRSLQATSAKEFWQRLEQKEVHHG